MLALGQKIMWMCNSIKVNKSWPTLSYLCIKRPIYISINQLILCWWGCHNLSVWPGARVVIVASVARAGCDGDAWLTEMSQYSMGNIKMWQLTWHLCHRKFTIGNHLNIDAVLMAMTKLLGCLLNKFQLLTPNIVCVWAQNVSCALCVAKTTFSKVKILVEKIFFIFSFKYHSCGWGVLFVLDSNSV